MVQIELSAAEIASQSVVPRAELVVEPGVLPDDLRVIGYSKKVRNVPESERRSVFAAYHIPWEERHNYELDHLVSLEIGGSNSQRNLWPELLHLGAATNEDHGACVKDRLENRLGELVRSGAL